MCLPAKDESLKQHVNRRLSEFRKLGKEGKTFYDFNPYMDIKYEADIFSELCFCILTANFSAEKAIKIQSKVNFSELNYKSLVYVLKNFGHRFPKQRAERIVKVKRKFEKIIKLIKEVEDPFFIRRLLADSRSEFKIEGFGYKEASHFLRNIGHDNLAILDRHVLRFLRENKLIGEVKNLTSKRYEEIERIVIDFARDLNLKPSALDLYIFYKATGKVLK